MELTCPKCQGAMRTYERNGVHVDQCSECRGIFLDRGELERLIDAENAWHSGPSAAPSRDDRPESARDDRREAAPGAATTGSAAGLGAVVNEVISQVRSSKSSSYGSSYGSSHGSGYPKKRKKESFLSDLFG
jgi:Zn-finger nucleic acid-binding protein